MQETNRLRLTVKDLGLLQNYIKLELAIIRSVFAGDKQG